MAKKIRELIQDLVEVGFCEIKGTGIKDLIENTRMLFIRVP